MKRSEINILIKETMTWLKEMKVNLPPFAYFYCGGLEYDEIRENMLGWDVTDYNLRKSKTPKEIQLSEAIDFAKFANCAAGVCVQRRGAIPAMPSLHEINLF
ncbi:MAG: D-lyxose/D-mannose family sugar isomerase [Clostridium sp.]